MVDKRYVIGAVVSMCALGCGAPRTFMLTATPVWNSVEVRQDVEYERAWNAVLDLIIKGGFDIEVSQKENGYIRTGWLYTWTGKYTHEYKVRATVKFSSDHRIVEVVSDAFYEDRIGYDAGLLQTLKTDIRGAVGRTTN